MRKLTLALLLAALTTGAAPQPPAPRTLAKAAATQRAAPRKIVVADGVYLFLSAPYGDVGLDGNSVVIVSRDGVLVFDTNGTPAAAAAVLAEIRKLTDRPVRYVVNSHWHWDHWYGSETYKQAFPDARVVAHERTRRLMMGPALDFNRPGIESQLPAYIRSIEARLAAAQAADAGGAEAARLGQLLAEDSFFLEQKASVRHAFPDLTYSDRLTLYLGEREIQLLHHERAVTPGDTFLYLPREKVLVTGDLLVNPISFALSCYPSGWLRTLERLDALDASLIVPGHGEPLADKALLRATMNVFRELLRQGKEARDGGEDVDQAKEAILRRLRPLMLEITRDDPRLNQAFAVQLVDWYLHRVYEELSGPLGDEIAPIPRS